MARANRAGYLALTVREAMSRSRTEPKAITMLRLLKYLPVVIPLVVKFAKDPRVKAAVAKARTPKTQR
jgi:hypothetical protein